MEGDQLTFFISYGAREEVIQLSEYDTVEQLKIEIDDKFDIAVARQNITGWHRPPISDDTILQICCRSGAINCLYINVMNSTFNTFEDKHLPVQNIDFIGHPVEADYLELELEAVASLKRKLPLGLPLTIQHMSLQNAVSYISNLSIQKKALLLYLHNSNDAFSQNFITSIFNDEINGILEKSFFVIGWDIENDSHHIALIEALKPHMHLAFLSNLITEKTGAAVCLFIQGDTLKLFSCLRGNITNNGILEHLTRVQEQCIIDESDSRFIEIEAIKSLRCKLPLDVSITLRHVSLEDAISFICTAPFNERKALFLYLHNSSQPFSQMFSQNLVESELARILNRKFLVLGWDVEDPIYHDALTRALNHQTNLAIISELVANKVAIGLCILPVAGTISVFKCLRGNINLKEAIKSLKDAEIAFDIEIEKEIKLDKIEREKSNKNDLGSEKLHAIWADMLGDRDYDSFEYNQHEFLKNKIGFALKGPPQEETGYDQKTLKHIDEVFEVIKTQSNEIAEYKDHIEVSFIYNCLEPLPEQKIKRAKKYPDYNPQTDVNPVPVFVLRRCRGSQNPCRVFIDHTQRVYDSWEEYLTKNKLAECEMVVPVDGKYQVVDNKVQLQRLLSPACHLDTKVLQVGDIISTAAGLASGAVFLTATVSSFAAITVAPAVLVAAGVAGAGAGAWAIGRSAYALYDRNKHKESMSFANSEARGAYINIVAGSLGFAGAGANMALTQLAARGVNIGQGATYLVNTVGALNLSASGVSLINSGYDVFDQWYNENQTPSALTIIQLSSSVLFFGHAVYSFKGAQTIVEETRAKVLKDYQDSLRSNRHRKTFNKMMKETMRTQGSSKGQAEVIRAIRNIQNKDEVFAALTRNNKAMNKAGVKLSVDGGKITLGGIPVDMNEFIGFNKKQTETFLNNLSSSNVNTSNDNNNNNNKPLNDAINNMLSDVGMDQSAVNVNQVISLTTKLLLFCSGDIRAKIVDAVHQSVRYILRHIAKDIVDVLDRIIPKNTQFLEFLRLGISFFSQKVDEWEQRYQEYQKTRDKQYYDPLFEKVNPLYVKRTVEIFEFVVRSSYSGRTLVEAVLWKMSEFIGGWIARIIFEKEQEEERDEMRDRHSAGFRRKQVKCLVCGGYYFQHKP